MYRGRARIDLPSPREKKLMFEETFGHALEKKLHFQMRLSKVLERKFPLKEALGTRGRKRPSSQEEK